jgi:hypothetical protein
LFTVTVPATDPNLLTPAEIRSAVGAATCSDEELRALNASISAAIARYCRVAVDGVRVPTLRLETVTETLRPCRPREIMLRRYPVTAVTSIDVDGTALLTSEFEVRGAAGVLARLSGDRYTPWSGTKTIVVYQA